MAPGIITHLLSGMASLVAFLGNGFIIVVLGQRWVQSRKMVPCDLLLISLGTSRFLFQLVLTMVQIMYIDPFWTEFHCCTWTLLDLAWIYFNIISSLCTTWLIVFYCVKITMFVHPLFLWLKPRISALVPQLLGMSLIAFTVLYIPLFVTDFVNEKCYNPTENLIGNTSEGDINNHGPLSVLNALHVAFIAIGFTICVIATILLLLSLWKHTRTLKKTGAGLKDLNTQAHTKVIKSFLFFLFFYIVYFVGMILSIDNSLKLNEFGLWLLETCLSSFFCAHTILLIWTNPKLKDVFVQIVNIRQNVS